MSVGIFGMWQGKKNFKKIKIKDFSVSSLPMAIFGVLMFYPCIRKEKKKRKEVSTTYLMFVFE